MFQPKIYNRTNFHKKTYCEFVEVKENNLPEGEPNYVSKSGSVYFFTESGVYRKSNHWGRAAKCRWKLKPLKNSQKRLKCGYADWTSFYADDDILPLYYIFYKKLEIGYEIDYQHVNHINYDGKAIKRNASETAKRIKLIKDISDSSLWFKYFENDSIDEVREKIISALIYTSDSLIDVKKKLF